jgi:hypothetical protein
LSAACGGRAEHAVLRGYFDTCAVADRVALVNGALVSLDPNRDGVVGRFRVVRVRRLGQRPAPPDSHLAHLSLTPYSSDRAGIQLSSRDVDVLAELHRAGGKHERQMTVTLTRAEGPERVGRWIVEKVVLDGQTLPAH